MNEPGIGRRLDGAPKVGVGNGGDAKQDSSSAKFGIWPTSARPGSHIGNRKCIRKKRNPESLSELNDSEQRLNRKEHRMKYPTSYRTEAKEAYHWACTE
jgi:hypothetical protein